MLSITGLPSEKHRENIPGRIYAAGVVQMKDRPQMAHVITVSDIGYAVQFKAQLSTIRFK